MPYRIARREDLPPLGSRCREAKLLAAKQEREHLDAAARKAREKATALKAIESDLAKAGAVAEQVVPSGPTLAAYLS